MFHYLTTPNGSRMRVIKNIEAHEFRALAHDKDTLLFQLQFEELFGVLIENYKDFYTALFRMIEEERIHQQHSTKSLQDIMVANRWLFNVMSAFRTYLDHAETSLKRLEKSRGDGLWQQHFDGFKKAAGDIFDSHASYRIFYQLRNYAQHCGLPITRLNVRERQISLSDSGALITYTPCLTRDELLESFGGWKQAEADLRGLPEIIDLKVLMNEAIHCVCQIHKRMREGLEKTFSEATARILTILDLTRVFARDNELTFYGASLIESDSEPDTECTVPRAPARTLYLDSKWTERSRALVKRNPVERQMGTIKAEYTTLQPADTVDIRD